MVRNEVFRWVQMLADERYDTLAEVLSPRGTPAEFRWSADDLAESVADYWDEYDEIATSSVARGSKWFVVEENGDTWKVTQILCDPDENGEWRLEARVDLAASRELDKPSVLLESIRPI